MLEFIYSHKMETLFALAILAGVWRDVDGRGQEWLPLPTWARNCGTLAIASCISVLVLGQTWAALWALLWASYALIRGFPKMRNKQGYIVGVWDGGIQKNIEHWLIPGLGLCGYLLGTGYATPEQCLIYLGAQVSTGFIYWFFAEHVTRSTRWRYLTEFSAGFNATGMIMVML